MKNFTKFLILIITIFCSNILIAGCDWFDKSDEPPIYYNIYTEKANCHLLLSESSAEEGENITVTHVALTDDYVLEKLVYIKGVVSNDTFTATSSTEYIITNNSFTMPNSAVKVVCKYRLKQQSVTIKSVTLSANNWRYDNYVLNYVAIDIGGEDYYTNSNVNSSSPDNKFSLTWDFTQTKNTYIISDNEVSLALYVNIKFNSNDIWEVNSSNSIIAAPGVSTTAAEIIAGYAQLDTTMTFNAYNKALEWWEQHNIVFALTVSFDVVEI